MIEVNAVGLGAALKQARESAGLSLTVAGARAEMSGSNFNRIENEDTKTVPFETLVRAANVVGLDLVGYLGEWIKQVPGVELGKENP